MAYCAKSDLVQRFGQREIDDLLDRDNDGDDDASTLDSTIADADSLIDSYVSSKYQTPLDPVPQIIKYISCDITRFMLWDDNAPEEVRNRYNDAIARLKDIAKGMMKLPATALISIANPSGGVDYYEEERVFTRDSLAGF